MILIQFALLLLVLLASLFALIFSLSFFFGAPFVTTPKKIVSEMVALAELDKNDVVADLGSGDGRILMGASKICKKAIGYEINPFLVIWSTVIVFASGNKKKVKVKWKNYKKAALRSTTVVILYSIRGHVPAIEKKLKKDLRHGTKIISYKFPISGFKLLKKTNSGIFLYIS